MKSVILKQFLIPIIKKNKCEIVDGKRIKCPVKYNTDGSSSFFPIDISYLVKLWGMIWLLLKKDFYSY